MPRPAFECSCARCQAACRNKPAQIAPLAKRLGISVADLFKTYLAVDWWNADDEIGHDVFVLSPAIVGESTGEMFPGNPMGTCVFFKDGCTIHDKGKPAHQKMIRELLGREPETAGYDGLLGRILGGRL